MLTRERNKSSTSTDENSGNTGVREISEAVAETTRLIYVSVLSFYNASRLMAGAMMDAPSSSLISSFLALVLAAASCNI